MYQFWQKTAQKLIRLGKIGNTGKQGKRKKLLWKMGNWGKQGKFAIKKRISNSCTTLKYKETMNWEYVLYIRYK